MLTLILVAHWIDCPETREGPCTHTNPPIHWVWLSVLAHRHRKLAESSCSFPLSPLCIETGLSSTWAHQLARPTGQHAPGHPPSLPPRAGTAGDVIMPQFWVLGTQTQVLILHRKYLTQSSNSSTKKFLYCKCVLFIETKRKLRALITERLGRLHNENVCFDHESQLSPLIL